VKPTVAVTMGDAAGIGPEIIVKCFSSGRLWERCDPFVLGDSKVMRQAAGSLGAPISVRPIRELGQAHFRPGEIGVLDFNNIDLDKLELGQVNPMCGKAAVEYTLRAGEMALDGEVDAIVSAPLNKDSMRQAGFEYEGQTQILGELAGSRNYGMFLLLGKLRIMMLTTHVSLREACDLVRKDALIRKIQLARSALELFGIRSPRLGVSALNPHCGEGGLFGSEEQEEIIPAVRGCRSQGIDVKGPVPADVIFFKAKNGEYDAVIAMYHDQATSAAKLLGFGNVVTLLAGVPFIRTSTGHGTAFDIAGKNIADPTNLREAILAAIDLAGKMKSRGKHNG